MNYSEAMQHHIQIEHLDAQLISEGINDSLMLAVRSLSAGI
jgi:hypothetical protein